MSAPEALHAQLAQRLFGWRWEAAAQLWRDPDGLYADAATFRRRLPAYTIEPRATALVWQWVERALPVSRVDRYTQRLMIFIARGDLVRCEIDAQWVGEGATWPEALCRAALALAAARENA